MTKAEEDAWCEARRAQVLAYLDDQGLSHGAVGDWPAWRIAPFVSIWAVESPTTPGQAGWWVICGDLPTDHCSTADRGHPRLAARHFAETWRAALAARRPGDPTLGAADLDAALADLLTARAKLLQGFAADDSLWPS